MRYDECGLYSSTETTILARTYNPMKTESPSAKTVSQPTTESEWISFSWPGKEEAASLADTPAVGSLEPMADESIHWNTTENCFIEGDNLEVLKLLQEEYARRIKMIYIDPPYNTGKEFIYRDRYPTQRPTTAKSTTAQPTTEKPRRQQSHRARNSNEAEGDARQQRHALWLSMIYPRLLLARRLLRDDGLIFISIGDDEVHHLRMLMNEIFGEENFVAQFVWNSSTAGGIRAKYVNRNHEYALCYAKDLDAVPMLFAPLSQEAVRQYRQSDAKGIYREKDFAWVTKSNNENQRYLIECPDGTLVQPRRGYLFRYVRERFEQALADDLVVFKATKTSPLIDEQGKRAKWNIYIKKYLGDAKGAPSSLVPKSVVGISNSGTSEIKRLFGAGIFNNPKPTKYLRYLLEIGLNPEEDGIVLDFFAGSCSMAHAVLAMNHEAGGNRCFVMVQSAAETPTGSLARQAGYATISALGRERIRRVLAELASSDTGADGARVQGVRMYRVAERDSRG